MPSNSKGIGSINGYATQHLQYLPYGVPKRPLALSSRTPLKIFSESEQTFVDQHGVFDSRYTFSAREKDDELRSIREYRLEIKQEDEQTQYSYFGARYYDSDLSVWLSVDPMASSRSWISPYNYCLWNPVGRVDPSGALDTEPERKKAVKRAREHLDKGTRYPRNGESFMGTPGGVADCSGLLSDCISYAGYPDHREMSLGVPDGNGGYYQNGVAIIVGSCKEIGYNEIVPGVAVTFRTNRKNHQGPNGKYDHIAIVTNVYYNEDGSLKAFDFIHSSTPGTLEMRWDFSQNRSNLWNSNELMLTGAYRWDNDEMYTGGVLNEFEIIGLQMMKPIESKPIPVDIYFSIPAIETTTIL